MPELERIRLDADTAARPGALRETIERFGRLTARADRDADGREGSPLSRRRARSRRRCGHRARDPRLPGGGANVPARHPARRAQRARCARARDRADVPAGCDAVRVRPTPRVEGFLARSSSAERRSAIRPSPTSCRSSLRAPTRPVSRRCCARCGRGSKGPRNTPRSGAVAAAARAPPGPARREDPRAESAGPPGGDAPRRGEPGAAPARADGRGRRRPAVAVSTRLDSRA